MKIALGTKIHNHIQQFHKYFKEGNISWLLAGRELIELKRLRAWQVDGSESRSWREWVDKSLLISGTTADRLIRVSERFGELLENNPMYADVDPTKLELIPAIDGQEKLIEWVEKCRNLSVRALKDEIAEAEGRLATDKCEAHDFELTMIERCKVCGLVIKKKIET